VRNSETRVLIMAGGELPEVQHTRGGGLSREVKEQIDVWIADLSESKSHGRREATQGLRLLTRKSSLNRDYIADKGGIPSLITVILETEDQEIRKHAVTTLLNLSINSHLKDSIVNAGGIDPIVEVLKSGDMEARENAAAALFSLSMKTTNKSLIGSSDAMPGLVKLLIEGSKQGKKDAASAIFDLAICHENKALAVRSGVIPPLIQLLTDEKQGMADEALATLAILATHTEGQEAIAQTGTAIPILVDIISDGVPRNKENATAILLELCTNDVNHVYTSTKLGVCGPLGELSSMGSAKARRKAKKLLDLHRHAQHLLGSTCGSRSI
jgi:hypothetical protein